MHFPVAIIDDFLGKDLLAALLDYALTEQPNFRAATIGQDNLVDQDLRKSILHPEQLGPLTHAFEAAMTARLDDIFASCGVPAFDVDDYELQLAAHRDGHFYDRHIDTFTGTDRAPIPDRLVSAVFYFHAEPKAFRGGELALYPFAGDGLPTLIEPISNRLVAFPSIAGHEVLPVSCPGGEFADARFSINCWLRRARAS